MKKYFIILACLFYFLFPALLKAEDLAVIKTEAVVSDLEGDFKKKAVDKAIMDSVRSALDSIMEREAITAAPAVTNAVQANPMDYVINYRIVSEEWKAPVVPQPIDPLQQQTQPVPTPQPITPDQKPMEEKGEYHVWVETTVDAVKLRAAVARAVGEKTSPVTVTILDVTDYKAYKSIIDSLERIAIVREVVYNSFFRGRIVLTVKSAGSSQALLERVSREVEQSYSVLPSGQTGIIIRPVKAAQ